MSISTFSMTLPSKTKKMRGKIGVLCGALVALNVLAWVWALVSFHAFPLLLGTALLAYTFG
ncbi:MAG: nickel transporter, partial [Bryobacteraceae bacterium]